MTVIKSEMQLWGKIIEKAFGGMELWIGAVGKAFGAIDQFELFKGLTDKQKKAFAGTLIKEAGRRLPPKALVGRPVKNRCRTCLGTGLDPIAGYATDCSWCKGKGEYVQK